MLELDVRYRRQNFCLDVQCRIEHAVTGVFGPSASGKTTLLHVIAGLLQPTSGRIICDGRVLFDRDRAIDEQPYRRHIAVVFQESRLFPHYSVDGNLRYGQRWLRRDEQRVSFNQVVDLLELGPLLNRRVQALSGGEQRRVAIGRALLSSPSLLLLDEPLTSLDTGLKAQVLPFLRRIEESLRIPMLYVSHDIGEILQLTEQLLVLENGRVLGLGPFHEVITDPAVIELARRLGLENVLPVEVLENVQDMGLSRLRIIADFPEPAVFWGPLQYANLQTKRYVAIRPEDIALADQPVTGVSIQNQICGQVRHVTTVANRALVEVDLGAPLLAEVSLKSVKELELSPGRKIYCLWKAHAVRYLDL